MSITVLEDNLDQIYSEYHDFFEECKLVRQERSARGHVVSDDDYFMKSLRRKRGGPNLSHIQLKSKEGNTMKITVSTSGWFELLSSSADTRFYETFESLMIATSPGFQQDYSDAISSKLERLQSNISHHGTTSLEDKESDNIFS